ncbi:MAG: PHP domain-containing protein [Clostridia bacterium]|nr:PHP domain-containing protein [Clostridia bacterium]
MFKTELHCHSMDVSECARVSVEDIVNKYTEAGYTTLVLSNHFNKGTMKFNGADTWDCFVEKFIRGYEKLKKCAEGKLNILLGAELRFDENVNDYLLFGITKEFLLSHPEMLELNPEKFYPIAKENGILVVQAHPFRNGMTVVNPSFLDGVEVFNGHKGHDSRNEIANAWAERFNLIKTSGTDFHYNHVPANAGILTEYEIISLDTLVNTLKEGTYQLIKDY